MFTSRHGYFPYFRPLWEDTTVVDVFFDGRPNNPSEKTVDLTEIWDAMCVILVAIPLLLPLVNTETVRHSSPYIILYVFSVSSYLPSSLQYKSHLCMQLNCWSLRCSWSIACRHCSNYIFILHLTPGLNLLRKDNCKPSREAFELWIWCILY